MQSNCWAYFGYGENPHARKDANKLGAGRVNPALLALILTQAQANWLSISYNIGSEQNEGYTLAAIVWEESSFCERKRNRWSVGCAGTKRSTVRSIFDPAATRARLESDNEYSIRAGLAILLYCKANTISWRRMAACYHYGLPHEKQMADSELATDPYLLSLAAKVRALEGVKVDEN